VREIVRSTQFKRDVKLPKKRGKDMAKLRDLILRLAEVTPLRRTIMTIRWVATGAITATVISSRIGFSYTELMAMISTWFAPEPTLTSFDLSCPLVELPEQLFAPVCQHHVSRSMSLDLPVIHHHDIGCRLESFCYIMRDIEGGNSPLHQPSYERLQDGNLEIRIHAGERLVQQQKARPGNQRASQCHPLLLAARKVAGHSLRKLAGLKQVEHLIHPSFA
jgi:hypothetical protein